MVQPSGFQSTCAARGRQWVLGKFEKNKTKHHVDVSVHIL